MRLVLLGAPGSGKGTQGVVLAEHFGVPHVSSGALLRREVAAGTTLGRRVEHYVASGELGPACSESRSGFGEAGLVNKVADLGQAGSRLIVLLGGVLELFGSDVFFH